MVLINTSKIYGSILMSKKDVNFFTLNATNTSEQYLLIKGLTHSSAIESIEVQTTAAITGATVFGIALYDQSGNVVVTNLLAAPQAVPTAPNAVTQVALGKHWMLSMGNITGKTASDTGTAFDLVLVFDAAITNTSDVGLTVLVKTCITQHGTIPGTGKTVSADQATPATP